MRIVFALLLCLFLLSIRVEAGAVEITYLGTNGYLLRAPGCTLVIDPYFTRLPLFRAGLDLTVRSDPDRVRSGLANGRVPAHVDGILVTHGHIDHLLDVPLIARMTRARVIASSASTELCASMGVPVPKLETVRWGDTERVGSAKVTVLPASHDRVLGRMPFPGEEARRLPPRIASDWVCGEPLAFLIEVAGQRIYVDSGGTSRGPLLRVRPVDLAILGVALPDSRARLPLVFDRLRPRYFLPSHQDNFFRPLERGFAYGPLTNAEHVERIARRRRQEMITLPYFERWTLR